MCNPPPLPATALPSPLAAASPAQVFQLLCCNKSSPPQLSVATLPTGQDECFFSNSFIVGLPYSLISCQFWVFFVFKFVVVLVLVVWGGTVYLPTPPSWLEVKYWLLLFSIYQSRCFRKRKSNSMSKNWVKLLPNIEKDQKIGKQRQEIHLERSEAFFEHLNPSVTSALSTDCIAPITSVLIVFEGLFPPNELVTHKIELKGNWYFCSLSYCTRKLISPQLNCWLQFAFKFPPFGGHVTNYCNHPRLLCLPGLLCHANVLSR